MLYEWQWRIECVKFIWGGGEWLFVTIFKLSRKHTLITCIYLVWLPLYITVCTFVIRSDYCRAFKISVKINLLMCKLWHTKGHYKFISLSNRPFGQVYTTKIYKHTIWISKFSWISHIRQICETFTYLWFV